MYKFIFVLIFGLEMQAQEVIGTIPTLAEATLMVQQAFQESVVSSAKSYCTKGAMTCRTMYQLKNKSTNEPLNIFYDTFFSADRQVGSTCYFIPIKDDPSNYYVFTDSVFDGKLAINLISPFAATVTVSENRDRVVFGHLKSPVLGTTKYSLSSFDQTESSVILDGTEYDSEDPNYSVPKHIEYIRIFP